jgi:hypothetical protein
MLSLQPMRPAIETPLPTLTNERTDKLDPRLAKLKVDMADPILLLARTDMEEPTCS